MRRAAWPAATPVWVLAAGCALAAVPGPRTARAHEGQPPPRVRSENLTAKRITGGQTLRSLAPRATVIVLGLVARTEDWDEDRLRLHRIRVSRVLRGQAEGSELGLVEIRGASERPPLVREGMTAVFLLRPTDPMSYLDEHLPPGTYWASVGEREGVILTATDAEVEAVADVLQRAAALAALRGEEQETAERALAFDELRSQNARLTADGVLELERLPTLEQLGDAELEVIGRVLRDTTVDPRTRSALARLIAARELREAVPALLSAAIDRPEVLAAVLDARARLGVPLPPDELRANLKSPDPTIRAAALAALADSGDAGVVPQLSRFALDDTDVAVRAAAIQALGRTGSPDALPTLARTFAESDRELKQRSAQALLAIQGPEADRTLLELALRSDSNEVRRHAALLLVVSRGRDHEVVRQLAAQNQDPQIRALLDEGLRFRHQHDHVH